MAYVFATRAYNMDHLDFHKLAQIDWNIVPHLNQPFGLNGYKYVDWAEADYGEHEASIFAGTDIRMPSGPNDPLHGTLTAILEAASTGGKAIWGGIQGISVGAETFALASDSSTTADDFDIIQGELSGADKFNLSTRNDLARGYGGNDAMNGNGGDGNDKLNGAKGNDHLFGDAGQDKLYGGAGKDTLDGGDDTTRDSFVFNDADSAVGTKRDVILHFTGGSDVIDLGRIDADASTSKSDDDFHWSGESAAAHSIWWTANTGGVVVSGDVTGDAKADFEIFLAGASTLTADDVLL
ncbi:M10 family metallopeptidase C-terminal domain-containing protein [Rubellimicrobium mesophilum]|nr:M10 family metallopeptidase C-terminal domain-containing protein [Rubellimicrobium mesophilum]